MIDSAITVSTSRVGVSLARRYALAFASVAGALLLELLFHHFNLPHSFTAFAMSAIALTFWYGGTAPGIVAVLLSALIRSFIFEGETSSLSRVLYELEFLIFAILMIWLRRRREALEVAIVDRGARLTAANEELSSEKEQLDGLFELSPDAVILTDGNFHVLRVNKEFTRMFGYTAEEATGKWLPELIIPEELRDEALQYRASLSSGKRVELETIRQSKGGVRFDVSVVAKGVSLGFGQVAVYLIYRDITERKNAKRKLERSEANLLESQRLVHMCSWAYEPSTGMVTCSPEGRRIFDIRTDLDTLTPDFLFDRVHPEDRPVLEGCFGRALLDKTDYTSSYRIVLPGGSIKHIYSVGHPILNQSGELVELVGTSMDVTEQWKAAEALRRSEGYLAEAQRLSHTGSFGWSIPSGELVWSEETFQIFQYDPATKPTLELVLQRVHPEDAALVKQTIGSALRDGKDFEHAYRLLMPDGSVKYLRVVANAFRGAPGNLEIVGAVTDITAMKQAEEKIRKQEIEFHQILDEGPQHLAVIGNDGHRLWVNQSSLEFQGLTLEQWRRCELPQSLHPDDAERFARERKQALSSGTPLEIEARHIRHDGKYRWFSFRYKPLKDQLGSITRWVAAGIDIDERKRAEQALRRSEAYLAEAQRLAKTGSWAYNPAAEKCIYWSDEMRRIFGLDLQTSNLPNREEFLRLVHPEDRDRFNEEIEKSRREKSDFVQDYRVVLTDGTVKHIHGIGHPLLDETGNIIEYVGSDVDVTERKRTEAKLRRSEADLLEAQRISQTGSWKLDVSSGKVTVSPQIFRIFGVKPDEDSSSIGFWLSRSHPEDQQRFQELFERCESQKTDYEADYRIVLPDGTIKHVHEIGHPVLSQSGKLVEMIGTTIDVTEQWKARTELERALEEIKRLKDQLHDENVALREQIDQAFMFEEIVGSSPALQTVLSSIVKVAPTDSTVLITGETGTGKELIARAIHKHSQRSGQAFISVNCASIPSSLIASELFGHEKGAFTGAVQRRQGRFELAHSGTIFLDEVGELPPETQVALLRVLQERQFERVGGDRVLRTDVRVIAATNRDLTAAIAAGTFRADLFYRLNVFPIEVPPLRKRKEDIPMLVEYFVRRFAEKTGKQICKIDKNTLALCQSYLWPGNIRELQNIIERSVILSSGETFWIEKAWLATEQPRRQELPGALADALNNQEKEMIEAALAESKGKVAGPEGAAAKLGIHRSTLDSKIKQLKIKKNKFLPE